MKKIEALQILQKTNKRIFNTPDLKKLFDIKNRDTINKQISGLIKAGVLSRIMKGFYYLANNRPLDFEFANILYRPSYISLYSALNFYGILVQTPQEITSVSPKLTSTKTCDGKTFSYAHLDKKYFTNYQLIDNFLIATPEKALVDTMFFVSLGKGSLSVEELDLSSLSKRKVKTLASAIKNKAFRRYFKTVSL